MSADPSDISRLAEDLLSQARTASSHRAAATVYGGSGHRLRQTLIALAAGADLAEHENPGEATLHVLVGAVTLSAEGSARSVTAGQLVEIPAARHAVHADSDAAVLVTVALPG